MQAGKAVDVSAVIRLNKDDDVVIARTQLVGGTVIQSEGITVSGLIPPGHKVASRAIEPGQPVRRYGQVIGFASRPIAPGEHVHIHNLAMGEFARDYAFCEEVRPTPKVKIPATFDGIVRADGKVATRNYIGILTSVNCSATVARAIAEHFRRDVHPGVLAAYPNIDGVIALTHGIGCAVDPDGEGLAMLRRTIAGYAAHPNFASVLIIGLGCETNQISQILETQSLAESEALRTFTIQDTGGTQKTIARGVELIESMLARANNAKRVGQPSHCGPAMWRVRWILRHLGQSRSRCSSRQADQQRRNCDPLRDA
jgi:altronate hydrolase